MKLILSSLWTWNITDVLPKVSSNLGAENNRILYVFAVFILGIIIGGMLRGVAKLVLGVVMVSGFVVLILMLMQKQDFLSMIASVVFGIIMLVFSFLVKLGKSYPMSKR